jgi:anaerobic magnesium-protoporphyrin IX monomethyl ester cyclase
MDKLKVINNLNSRNKENFVLLINPVNEDKHLAVLPPIGLAYLAGVLEKNKISVKILDANAYRMDNEEIIKQIKKIEPTIIGITAPTALLGSVSDLSKKIKEELLNILIVFGGPHPTAEPAECLEIYNADVAARGEGEHTLLELCQKYDGTIDSLIDIRGISYKVDGKVFHNSSRGFIHNLDELPFPARHLLPMDKYKTLGTSARFTTILTSRGCPGKCMYCTKVIFGSRFRTRSPQNVIVEIKELVDEYKIEEINFVDDTFSSDIERAEKICDEIIRQNLNIKLRLSNGLRVDSISERLLKKLKKAGCYQISYGVESGDDEVLKKIGKEVTTQQIKRAFEMTKKEGIEILAFFMLGLPFDTVKTMEKTIAFAKELDPDYAQFTITTPLPKTRLWSWLKSNGTLLVDVDWAKFGLINGKICFETEDFKKEDVEKMFKKAYRSFYLRPKYIFKALLKIRSLKDVKRHIGNGRKHIMKK